MNNAAKKFCIEALEPRLLLSGDGLDAAAVEMSGGATQVDVAIQQSDRFESQPAESWRETTFPDLFGGFGEHFREGELGGGAGEMSPEASTQPSLLGLNPAQPVLDPTPEEEVRSPSFSRSVQPEGGTLTVTSGEVLSGNRTINSNVVSSGTISPGNSPGILNITGDLALGGTSNVEVPSGDPGSTTGALRIEIGGLTAGAGSAVVDDGFDQVNVDGDVTLAGRLEVRLINGFEPQAGQTFDFLTYTGELLDSTADADSNPDGFTDATGLFGFGDRTTFIKIVHDTNNKKVSLVVTEVPMYGPRVIDLVGAGRDDQLGQLFNELFPSVMITGSLNFHGVEASGTFGFSLNAADPSNLTVNVHASNVAFSYGSGETTLFAFHHGAGEMFITEAGALGAFSIDLASGPTIPDVTINLQTIGLTFNSTGSEATLNGQNLRPGFRVEAIGAELSVLGQKLTGNFAIEQFTEPGVMLDPVTGEVEIVEETTTVLSATALTLALGPVASPFLTLRNGSGTFMLAPDGFAGEATVTVHVSLPVPVGLSGQFTLAVNTTERSINERFSVGGDSVALVAPAGPYIRISGRDATLTALGETFSASFNFERQVVNASVIVKGGVSGIDLFLGMNGGTPQAAGLQIREGRGGIVISEGGLAMKATAGLAAVGVPGVTLGAETVSLEVNTGIAAVAENVFTGDLEADGVTPISVNVSVPGNSLRVSVTNGVVALGGVALTGNFSFGVGTSEAGSRILTLGMSHAAFSFTSGGSTILGFGNGAGNVVIAAEGAYGRFSADLIASPQIPGISVTFTSIAVAFNTTGSTVSLAGSDLRAGFRVEVTGGALTVLSQTLTGNFMIEQFREPSTVLDSATGEVRIVEETTTVIGVSGLTLALGPVGSPFMTLRNGSGAFMFAPDGFAGEATVTVDVSLPAPVGLSGEFTLAMNTTERSINERFSVGGDSVPLVVPAGPYIRISGRDATLSAMGKSFTASFNFERQIINNETVIRGGVSGINTFIGVNGGTANAVGVQLIDGRGGVLVTDAGLALTATAGVRVFGIPGVNLGAERVALDINTGTDAVDESVFTGDYAEDGVTPINADLDIAGNTIRVVLGEARLEIGDLVFVSGDFSFTSGPTGTATLSDGTTKSVSVLTVGASHVNVFVGIKGPATNPGAVGLGLNDVGFALAIVKPTDTSDSSSYYGLAASATTIELVGLDEFEMPVENLEVQVNGGTDATVENRVIDFTKGDLDGDGDQDGVTSVATGPLTEIDFDFAGRLLRAAGRVTLNLFDFVFVQGDIAVTRSSGLDVTLTDGTEKTVDVLTIGASGLDIFVGSGPYFVDSNSDGAINDSDTPSDGAIGLVMENVDFALAFYTPEDDADQSRYHAVSASADSVALVGFGGGGGGAFTMTARAFRIELSGGSDPDDPQANPAIDFTQLPGGKHAVDIGGGRNVDFNYQSALIRVSIVDAVLDIAGFIQIFGSFSYTKLGEMEVTLDDGSKRDVSVNALGASGVNVFVGSGPYFVDSNLDGVVDGNDNRDAGAVGLVMEDLNVGLLTMRTIGGGLESFTALKLEAELVSFVGVDAFQFAGRKVEVEVNSGNKIGDVNYQRVVNFSEFDGGSYILDTGSSDIAFDATDTILKASVAWATLTVGDYPYISGSFAFTQGGNLTAKLTDDDETSKAVRSLQIGAENVSIFFGDNGPYRSDSNGDGLIDLNDATNDAALGLSMTNVDIAAAILKPVSVTDRARYFGIKASADEIALVGISDIISFEATGALLSINGVAGDASPSAPVVNFKTFAGGGLGVQTGASTVLLDFDGPSIRAAVDHAKLTISEYVQIEGSFNFEKGKKYNVKIATGIGPQFSQLVSGLEDDANLFLETFDDLLQTLPDRSAGLFEMALDEFYLELTAVTDAVIADVSAAMGQPTIPWADDLKLIAEETLREEVVDPMNEQKDLLLNSLYGFVEEILPGALTSGFVGTAVEELFLDPSRAILEDFIDGVMSTVVDRLVAEINKAVDKVAHAIGDLAVPTAAQVQQAVRAVINEAVDEAKAEFNRLIVEQMDVLMAPVRVLLAPFAAIRVGEGFRTLDNVEVSATTVGARDVRVFFGLGKYKFDAPIGSQDAVGFFIDDLTFGGGIFKPIVARDFLSATTFKLMADGFGFVSGELDAFTLAGRGIQADLNTGSYFPGMLAPMVIDYAASFPAAGGNPAGLRIETSANGATDPVYLDFDGNERIAASVEAATLSVSEFFNITGSFAFEKGSLKRVTMATGLPSNLLQLGNEIVPAQIKEGISGVFNSLGLSTNDLSTISGLEVATMTLGVRGSAFAGINGPYYRDVNGDGISDIGPQNINEGAMGLVIQEASAGFVLMEPTLARLPLFSSVLPSKFYAAQASAPFAGLVGVGNEFQLSAQDLELNLNSGEAWAGGWVPTVDFAARFPKEDSNNNGILDAGEDNDGDQKLDPIGLELPTGSEPIYIAYGGGELAAASVSNATLKISEFVYLYGNFAFEKGPRKIVDISTGFPGNIGGSLTNFIPQGAIDALNTIGLSSDLSTIRDVEVSTLSIGAANLSAFIGMNGPYLEDRDHDGDLTDETPNPRATGLILDDLDMGFVMMTPTLFPPQFAQFAPKLTAASATASQVGLIGFGDDIILNATNLQFRLNTGRSWFPGGWIPVADFQSSFPAEVDADGDRIADVDEDLDADGKLDPVGFEVRTGNTPVYIDYGGEELLGASMERATLKLADAVYLTGSFAFEKGPRHEVDIITGLPQNLLDLADEIVPQTFKDALTAFSSTPNSGFNLGNLSRIANVEVATLSIGASNMTGFVGLGGPYLQDLDGDGSMDDETPNPNSVGVSMAGLDFGFVMMTPTLLPPELAYFLPRFFAMRGEVDFGGVVGIDAITAEIFDLAMDVNFGTPWHTLPGFMAVVPVFPPGIEPWVPVVDFESSFPAEDLNNNQILDVGEDRDLDGGLDPAGFEVFTGDDPVYLDFDSQLIRVKVGRANLEIADVVGLSGSFAFVMGPTIGVTLTNGSTKTVRTMSIAGSNMFAFAGFGGPYWRDSNGDLLINSNDTPNPDAVGLSLENVDVGILLMRPTNVLDQGLYLAAKLSADSIGLVGVEGVNAQGTNLTVKINLGVSVLDPNPTAVVDFTRLEGGKYSIDTGNALTSIDIDYGTFLIAASGALTLRVSGMVEIQGVFDFELSSERFLVFVDATASFLLGGTPVISGDALGLLVIDSDGLGLRLELSTGFNLASVLEFDADVSVYLNTTGKNFTYSVPEGLRDEVGYSSLTIAAGPPQLDGSQGPPGFYLVLKAIGDLSIASLFELHGQFYLEISENEFELQINATTNLLIGSLAAADLLRINREGVVGSLQMGLTVGSSGLGSNLFVINGTFQLEINSTSASQAIRTLDVLSDGTVAGLKNGTIAAHTYRLVVGGSLHLLNTFTINGRLELNFSPQGFEVTMDAALNLGNFGKVAVRGGAAIMNENGTPVFAINLGLGANAISIPSVTIEGNFTLQINTSSSTAYVGVNANTYRVSIDATVRVLLFEAKGNVTLGVSNGVFSVELNNLSMNFFNFITLQISGYVRSNGQFKLNASASMEINFGPFVVYGGFEIEFSNTRFYGRIYGGVDFEIDLGLFSIDFTIASVEAEIEFTIASAAASLKVTAFGFSFSGSIWWSWGAPPVIATQIGDVLRLNMGVDSPHLGELYEDISTESFSINHVSGAKGNETVRVQSLGVTREFSGVRKILVNNTLDGNDFIYVAPGVLADVEVTGGSGDDTFYITGSGNHIVRGGDGSDYIEAGSGSDTLTGNSGQNTVRGGPGNDTITVNSGNDNLEGLGGNDVFHLSSGSGAANGGDDSDLFVLSHGSWTVNGGLGSDSADITGGAGVIDLGEGDDVINFNRPTNPSAFNDFTISDDVGVDVVNIDMDSVNNATVANNHRVIVPGFDIEFSSGLDRFNISDSAPNTRIVTSGANSDFGATHLNISARSLLVESGLKAGKLEVATSGSVEFRLAVSITDDAVINSRDDLIVRAVFAAGGLEMTARNDLSLYADVSVTGVSSGVDGLITGAIRLKAENGLMRLDNTEFSASQGHLSLDAVGFTAPIRSVVKYLTAINRGSGSDADVIVREFDDLVLVDDGLSLGAIHSSQGLVDLELGKKHSLLTLQSGVIRAAGSSSSIRLTADDMDFKSGENKILGSGHLTLGSKFVTSNYAIGSGAENSAGDDLSTNGPDNSLDLSMRDMAAFANGFSRVTIGHSALANGVVANGMTVGDVENATHVKSNNSPRVVNAVIRDHTVLVSDRIDIRGDVQAPANRIEFFARLVEINKQNLHDANGLADSGVSGKEVIFEVSEQMSVEGWIRGEDSVDVHIQGTRGISPIIPYEDGPNSLTTGLLGIFETLNNGSRIEIQTSGSIKFRSTLEAKGVGSIGSIDSGTHFTLFEGGKLVARGVNGSISVVSDEFIHVNSGSAITAGAEFVDQNGTPVASLTGVNADITLNAQGEIWVAGAVTASRNVFVHGGDSSMPHADYFDTIPGKLKFSTLPDNSYVVALDAGNLSSTLKAKFEENGIEFSAGDTTVVTIEATKRWVVHDAGGAPYVLYI